MKKIHMSEKMAEALVYAVLWFVAVAAISISIGIALGNIRTGFLVAGILLWLELLLQRLERLKE